MIEATVWSMILRLARVRHLPFSRWHVVQWQYALRRGLPVAVKETEPHEQDPFRDELKWGDSANWEAMRANGVLQVRISVGPRKINWVLSSGLQAI